eukprot:scpid13926/ scgid35642/ 
MCTCTHRLAVESYRQSVPCPVSYTLMVLLLVQVKPAAEPPPGLLEMWLILSSSFYPFCVYQRPVKLCSSTSCSSSSCGWALLECLSSRVFLKRCSLPTLPDTFLTGIP